MIAFKWLIIYLLTQVYVTYAVPHTINNDLDVIWNKEDNSSLYRLPTKVRPVFYNITLLTNVTRSDFIYRGIVIIDLNVFSDTKEIVLHAEKLKINATKSTLKKKITDVELEKLEIQSQNYDAETQFYKIISANSLTPGNYQLSLYFVGEVLDDLFGFYRSSYKKNGQVRWMGVTQFSPTFARRAFPCMDEPGFKATFQLNIGHYSNETVTSNTFAESRELIFADEKSGNYYITHFARTPRMSTYLVGWSIHDFERANSTKLHMWLWSHFQNIKSNKSPILFEGPLIEAALETYTSMSNPVRKFEQIAVPDFYFSAMENWGMVTYREAVGLTNYDSTPERVIFSQLTTQSHEYSHSYFGNLVTPNFWDVAWLKEGFATYFGYLSLGSLHEDWRMMEIFAVSDMQSTLISDSDPDITRTMNGRGVGSPASAKAALDFVTYGKGASVIRMFADVLGEKPFRRAMHSYLRRRKYESVIPKDLYEELDLVANGLPTNIGDLFDSWANQTNYPLVQASRSENQVTLSQRSFDFSGNAKAKHWWIPIELFAPNFKSELHWLSANNETLSIKLQKEKNPWFVINPHLSGYYRVDYDNKNWQALIDFLKTGSFESLPSVSRAALIDDAFNLARANLRNFSLSLSLISYVEREQDYMPWVPASRTISLFDDKFRDRPELQRAFRRYAIKLITPIYEELTAEEEASDSFIRKMHRELILPLACNIGLKQCVSAAKSAFDRWIANETLTIPRHLKISAYRIGVINGSNEDWESLWRQFLQTDSYVDKAMMIDALASTNNSSFANKLFEFSIEPNKIAKQYQMTIVNSVINRNFGTTLKYVHSNLSKIIKMKGIAYIESLLDAFGARVSTTKQKQELVSFLNENDRALGPVRERGKKALKAADANIKWIDRCATEVQEYFDKTLKVIV